MNNLILTFFVVLLTARFFSETIQVIPKVLDLIDLLFIPLIAILAAASGPVKGVDTKVHRRVLMLVSTYATLCVASAVVNFERTFLPPTILYIFGILEGPVLFLALNKVVKHKEAFGQKVSYFLYIMFLVEAGVVFFVNIPMFFATGNPDVMSGTFGTNAYQFSALLIIIGGYFLGKMKTGGIPFPAGVAIQGAVFITFLMLQYRTATPAFFLTYLLLVGVIYGKRVLRLGVVVAVFATLAVYAFQYVQESEFDLKFDDLATLASDPAMMRDFGKVLAYFNTFEMFGDEPITIVFGAGPGTMVSRSAYTFIVEPTMTVDKGVGKIIEQWFGAQSFSNDAFQKYMAPLFDLESVFGSVQANNPASSILASLAELGIFGLAIIVLLYFPIAKLAFKYLRYAADREDPELLPLAAAMFTGMIYLCFLSPLDNYLEIARVTLPVWLMFWTVSMFVTTRMKQERTARQLQLELLEQERRALLREHQHAL